MVGKDALWTADTESGRRTKLHQRYVRPSDGAVTYLINARLCQQHGGTCVSYGLPPWSWHQIQEHRPCFEVSVSETCPRCKEADVDWTLIQELQEPTERRSAPGRQITMTEVMF